MVFGKVDALVVDSKAPTLPLDGTVDEAIVAREVHGWVNSGTLDAWLSAIHKALKPDGVLGIEEHRAIAGADPIASAKNGYVPEKWLVDHVESAGFTLAGKSEINANPKDTKDYSAGVWALPPTLQLGDKDREKYVLHRRKRPHDPQVRKDSREGRTDGHRAQKSPLRVPCRRMVYFGRARASARRPREGY